MDIKDTRGLRKREWTPSVPGVPTEVVELALPVSVVSRLVVERRVVVREMGNPKPIALVDYTNEGPRIILNGQVEHEGEVIDLANSRLHYDEVKIEKKERKLTQQRWADWVEERVRAEDQKYTYGAETKGRMHK